LFVSGISDLKKGGEIFKMEQNRERESFEQLVERYPEMDEAARRRAAARIAAGADAAHALNDEVVWAQLTKAYNN
jgi:hypothetical protein